MLRALLPSIVAFMALLALAFLAVSNTWVLMSSRTRVSDDLPSAPPRQVVIVLGAGVRGEELSGALRARMQKALEIHRAHLADKILVSGDGTHPHYNETGAMKRFALRHEIDASDVLTDALGYSTYASLLRAREVFDVSSAYIVSQRYHLYRAVWLARKLGIEAQGIVASPHQEEPLYSQLREIPARAKDVFLWLGRLAPASDRPLF